MSLKYLLSKISHDVSRKEIVSKVWPLVRPVRFGIAARTLSTLFAGLLVTPFKVLTYELEGSEANSSCRRAPSTKCLVLSC
jgi:hypothetical protein